MKVALSHDWLNQYRGGERVLEAIHDLHPTAPVYTSVYNKDNLPGRFAAWDVRTSFLQRLPLGRGGHRMMLPLMPLAFEQFDLSSYDLVISSSSAVAKGVIPSPDAVHICYCHTPCRYIWDQYHEYSRGLVMRSLTGPVAHWLRMWDQLSSQRVDHFVANSEWVARRIRRYYGREAEVIHPPVAVDRIVPNGLPSEDFYLVVSSLVGYKRIDLAVRAANRLKRRLVVVGEGPQLRRLQGLAGPTVEVVGGLPDGEVAELYARCRAFLFPGKEDFGIAPVEAQAAGRPVIAYSAGGALETVIDGETGVFFEEQEVDALCEAMLRLEAELFDPAVCRKNAKRFHPDVFRARFSDMVTRQLSVGGERQARRVTDGENATLQIDGSEPPLLGRA